MYAQILKKLNDLEAEIKALRLTPSVERMLTVGEVARTLRVSAKTVRAYIHAGELNAYKLSRGNGLPIYVVRPEAIEKFLCPKKAVASAVAKANLIDVPNFSL